MAKKTANTTAPKTSAKPKQNKKKAVKSPAQSKSVLPQSNENWQIVECPECKDGKPPKMLKGTTPKKWHLHCETCDEKWFLNIDTNEILKDEPAIETSSTQTVPAAKRGKKPFEPHVTRPTPQEKITILERQNLVLDLKTNGISFRKIHAHLLKKNYDVSLGTVYSDYVASLERLQETNVEKTELLVLQELEKIEDWESDLNALKSRKLSVYEIVAIKQTLIALQNQRDKFKGFSKPKIIKIQNDLDFAKALGINPEELPDVDETED